MGTVNRNAIAALRALNSEASDFKAGIIPAARVERWLSELLYAAGLRDEAHEEELRSLMLSWGE